MDNEVILELSVLPKELQLILLLIEMHSENRELTIDESFKDIDWSLFVQLVKHHRVYPTIYLQLKKMNDNMIPKFVIESLQKMYNKNVFHMLLLSREMVRISKIFAENNVRLLILKGPVLAVDLYGDISLRTSVDLDVLVSIKDLDKIDNLLLDIGYFRDEYFKSLLGEWKWRHHHLNYIDSKSGLKLELHWRLTKGPGKEPGFDELWKNKRMSSLSSNPVYYLGKEELFLYLVSHGARHGWSRLSWLVDIRKMLKQNLDLNKLHQLLKEYQRLHIGGQALILLSQLFKTSISKEKEILKFGNRSKKLAREALFYIKQIISLHSYPVPEDIARYHKRYLFSLMSYQQKFLFTMSFFYPYPMDAEILPLPKILHFLYFPLRPFLWAWRKTRNLSLS